MLGTLPAADEAARSVARDRQGNLTKPPGSLGRLEELAIFLAGWGRQPRPLVDTAKTVVFAGNHGVTAQGVSPYPPDVTMQMVANFHNGGAAINAITNVAGAQLQVIALDLDEPTQDITVADAMSEDDLLAALNAGAEAVTPDLDLIAVGEMGIGNTTIAAALAARCFGGTGADWAGPGTGLDDAGVKTKAQVIDKALARYNKTATSLTCLKSIGGREIAAIAGAVVAARHQRVPVVLDGYVATAAVAPLYIERPEIVDHCIAGHVSAEPAHRRLLSEMQLDPLLDLGMRLGEGTGASLAITLLKAAAATHNNMATFAEAAVSNRDS
ncbi:MAG: nicotinate-nucleotide--dimethylbenzimidazole phosphoribosyltransferase [Hyphomicrobiaceae bacterium]